MIKALLDRFVRCEAGATAIEYGLIAAVIGAAIITLLRQIGTSIEELFVAAKVGFDGAQ